MIEDSGIATAVVDKTKILWQTDMKNVVYELIGMDKETFPTYNAVLKAVYLKMRDNYGIVIDQIRKEYRDRYGLDYFPDAMEAIADDSVSRQIFETILRSFFPDDYWSHRDGVLDAECKKVKCVEKTTEDEIREIIRPLAEKYNDISKGWNMTFQIVYKNMDCSWSRLQIRYRKANNLKANPRKLTIVANNPAVFRKFKKTVHELLDKED